MGAIIPSQFTPFILLIIISAPALDIFAVAGVCFGRMVASLRAGSIREGYKFSFVFFFFNFLSDFYYLFIFLRLGEAHSILYLCPFVCVVLIFGFLVYLKLYFLSLSLFLSFSFSWRRSYAALGRRGQRQAITDKI